MNKHLHIISLNVPYPADYGGVVDLFYKLPALQLQGVQVHLHCFDYGRGEQKELEKYCASVQYYERYMGHKGISNRLPYIVSSRKNEHLMQELLKDDYPILMEGVHCTYLLLDKRFEKRKCFVRLHNVEYQYYRDISAITSSLLKKLYYRMESILLKAHEKKIASKAWFWGITEKDNGIYREKLGCEQIDYLPLFIPGWTVQCMEGMGTYCLYHGDLSADANEKAVCWLLEKVFRKLEVPFVITGRNPSQKIYKLARANPQTCIIANPREQEMQDMIGKAHINLIPSFSATGIKIKLVNALFNGRHCVVNEATVAGSGLEAACHVGTTPNAFREIVAQLYHQPFTTDEIELRKRLLNGMFDNKANAKKIAERI